MGIFCFGLMSACMGFLVWNWHPAKIFLGDSGSLMLGGLFAVIVIIGQQMHQIPLIAYLLLFSLFLGDATYTLITRLFKGEKIWLAHRDHTYQQAVSAGYSHGKVTGFVLVLTVLISLPTTLVMRETGPTILLVLSCACVLVSVLIYVHRLKRVS